LSPPSPSSPFSSPSTSRFLSLPSPPPLSLSPSASSLKYHAPSRTLTDIENHGLPTNSIEKTSHFVCKERQLKKFLLNFSSPPSPSSSIDSITIQATLLYVYIPNPFQLYYNGVEPNWKSQHCPRILFVCNSKFGKPELPNCIIDETTLAKSPKSNNYISIAASSISSELKKQIGLNYNWLNVDEEDYMYSDIITLQNNTPETKNIKKRIVNHRFIRIEENFQRFEEMIASRGIGRGVDNIGTIELPIFWELKKQKNDLRKGAKNARPWGLPAYVTGSWVDPHYLPFELLLSKIISETELNEVLKEANLYWARTKNWPGVEDPRKKIDKKIILNFYETKKSKKRWQRDMKKFISIPYTRPDQQQSPYNSPYSTPPKHKTTPPSIVPPSPPSPLLLSYPSSYSPSFRTSCTVPVSSHA